MTEYQSPLENPALAMQDIDSILREDPVEIPTIDSPTGAFASLVAGLVVDEKVLTEVDVEELNGYAEERLARVEQSSEPGKWVQTLLEFGVNKIGDVDATPEVLKSLLIGDRDLLVLAVRNATYGPVVEYGDAVCPECREEFPLSISIDNIPVRPLESERQFRVDFPTGGYAEVRLPTGVDQLAVFDEPDASDAERNSILLSRCVLAIADKNGEVTPTAGFPSTVRSLGVTKRQAILKALNEKSPGPQYDGVEFTHECGFKMPVPVGLMHLFPGL